MSNFVVSSTSDKDLSHNNIELHDEGLARSIIRNNDEKAFKILVNQYASRIYHLVLIFTLNHKLSKKVTQDVFQSVKTRNATDTPEDFKTWLFAVTFSICRKYLKDSDALNEGRVNDKDQEMQGRMFPDRVFDIKEGPLYALGNNSSEFIPLVEKALYELPAPYRVAVYLSDIEKMSSESIQRVLGFSVSIIEFMICNSRLYIMQQLSNYIKDNRVL